MCGILGIMRSDGITDEHTDIFNDIFKQSQQRGSDAFGFYTYPRGVLFKKKGGIKEFLKKNRIHKVIEGNNVVLAHTRASTTGTEDKNKNNHPFQTKDFVFAHNGCIWNHDSIKKKFKTDIETDSIVILKLIQEEYDKSNNIAQAIITAAKELRGSYACWLLFKRTGSLYLFRHNNPIYLGYNEKRDMYVFASEKNYLSFLEESIKQKFGFKEGLAFADIEENKVYRLTNRGLSMMGEFKPNEYTYSNVSYVRGGCQTNLPIIDEDGQLETIEGRVRVTDEDSFRLAWFEDSGFEFSQMGRKLEWWGITLDFQVDKLILTFSEKAYRLLGNLLDAYGLTISPKTLTINVEYPKLTQCMWDISEILQEEY